MNRKLTHCLEILLLVTGRVLKYVYFLVNVLPKRELSTRKAKEKATQKKLVDDNDDEVHDIEMEDSDDDATW